MRYLLVTACRHWNPTIRSYSAVAHDIKDVQIDKHVKDLAEKVLKLNMIESAQLGKFLQEALGFSAVSTKATNPIEAASIKAADTSKENSDTNKPPEAAKSVFKVVLDKIDAASKAKIIREIKQILPQLNLVEAKTLVEGAPKTLKENCKKDEAEKIKTALEGVGATISLL